MKTFLELALFFIIAVNIAVILATCFINSGKMPRKKSNAITIGVFSANLVFDLVLLIGFAVAGLGEYAPAFAFFMLVIILILCGEIQEAKSLR